MFASFLKQNIPFTNTVYTTFKQLSLFWAGEYLASTKVLFHNKLIQSKKRKNSG